MRSTAGRVPRVSNASAHQTPKRALFVATRDSVRIGAVTAAGDDANAAVCANVELMLSEEVRGSEVLGIQNARDPIVWPVGSVYSRLRKRDRKIFSKRSEILLVLLRRHCVGTFFVFC